MEKVRKKSKELDPYLKARIGEAIIQVRELAKPSNLPGTQRVYYTGNWVKDIYDNYTDKQAQKVFNQVHQFRDQLDFFQVKLNMTDGDGMPSYEYIARKKA